MKGGAATRPVLRWVVAALYAVAGAFHILRPQPFLGIMPGWVPAPETVVWLTGIAELLGATALAQPMSKQLRRVGGIALALYALCVWPANFQHMAIDMSHLDGGLGLGYHVPRLLFQPVLVWLALWTGEVTDWPLARR